MMEANDAMDIAAHAAGEKKTVVLFEMTGCPYCVAYRQRVDDLVAERPDLNFVRAKLDDPGNPLWEQYGIHAVPTFIAFEKGAIIARADSILALGLSKKKWLDFCAGL